jgi:hypothetical protein
MPKFKRSDKLILVNNINENDIIKIDILIDSNHINNGLDQLLQTVSSIISTFPNYKIKKEEPKEKPVKKSKKVFGSNANFV